MNNFESNDLWEDDRLDELNEECGVFGIYSPTARAAEMTYYGLFSLQHRGQEGCGIAASDGKEIHYHKNTGLVTEAIKAEDLKKLPGKFAIGHVRYSTTGENSALNTQPVIGYYLRGQLAVAHNGNLTNTGELRKRLNSNGSVFQTTIDTEVILNLLALYSHDDLLQAIMKTMLDLKGSYSLVIMNENQLIGVRDPHGNRPLCVGETNDGGYVLASETCALDTVGAKFLRDVKPGEIIIIDENGMNSYQGFSAAQQALCVFEYVYFARPDSNIDGLNVSKARRQIGRELAREIKLDVDMVIPVPDSGTAAAIGYAEEAGLPFNQGIMKNRYAGRTFIQPTQEMRELMVQLKLSPIREELEGKSIAVVDDSIVRGTTSRRLIKRLREQGAKEVHFLVCSPPVKWPCYYGIDTADRDKLIAANKSVEEICEYLGADSLHYLSLEGLLNAVKNNCFYCTACFSGDYPMGVPDVDSVGKDSLERSKRNN